MEQIQEVLKKVQKAIAKLSDVMELVIALAVAVALVIAAIRYIPASLEALLTGGRDTTVFYKFLEEIFLLVIGIEFIKMLCQPKPHNVIEVILFLIARHMIIGNSGAVDNLFSVAAIIALFLLERYLQNDNEQ